MVRALGLELDQRLGEINPGRSFPAPGQHLVLKACNLETQRLVHGNGNLVPLMLIPIRRGCHDANKVGV